MSDEFPTPAERQAVANVRELTAGLAFGLPPDVEQYVVVPDDSHRHVVGPDHRYGDPGQRRFEVRVYDLGAAS